MKKFLVLLLFFIVFNCFAKVKQVFILSEHSGVYLCYKDGKIAGTTDFNNFYYVGDFPFEFEDVESFFFNMVVSKWSKDKVRFYLIMYNRNINKSVVDLFCVRKGKVYLERTELVKGLCIDWEKQDKGISIIDKIEKKNFNIQFPKEFIKNVKWDFPDIQSHVFEGIWLWGIYYPNYLVFGRSRAEVQFSSQYVVFNCNTEKITHLKFKYHSSIFKTELIPLGKNEYILISWHNHDSPCAKWGLNDDGLDMCIIDFADIYYVFPSLNTVKVPVERCWPEFIVKNGKCIETHNFSNLKHVQKLSDKKIAFVFSGIDITSGKGTYFTLVYDLAKLRKTAVFYLDSVKLTGMK